MLKSGPWRAISVSMPYRPARSQRVQATAKTEARATTWKRVMLPDAKTVRGKRLDVSLMVVLRSDGQICRLIALGSVSDGSGPIKRQICLLIALSVSTMRHIREPSCDHRYL